MKIFKDMTPMERLDFMRTTGVILFPNLTKEEKRSVMYIENEMGQHQGTKDIPRDLDDDE